MIIKNEDVERTTSGHGRSRRVRSVASGCGLMGSGIAQVVRRGRLRRGRARGRRRAAEEGPRQDRVASWPRASRRARSRPSARQEVLGRLTGTTDARGRSADCDLVIEAVVENLDAKREVYQALDAACPPHTIFASNTSSLSITEMAATTKRADRFVGLHFFNPVPLMKLVEVVRSPLTSPEAFEEAFGVRAEPGQDAGARHRQDRLHREPAAGAVPARRHPRPRGRRRLDRRTSTRACGWAAAIPWARSRCSTSSASTPPTTSPTSCSTSSARSASRRRRCSSGWCRPASTAGRPGKGFYDYSQEPPQPVAGPGLGR